MLSPAPGQLVEKLLVQHLVGFLRASGQEDVATDKLVHYFAVGRQTPEHHVTLLELDHHQLGVPVYIPRLQQSEKKEFVHRI